MSGVQNSKIPSAPIAPNLKGQTCQFPVVDGNYTREAITVYCDKPATRQIVGNEMEHLWVNPLGERVRFYELTFLCDLHDEARPA